LEIACGTGLWTEALARGADSVVAIDAAPEAVAIARTGVRSENVTFVVADVFSWTTDDRFDVIFFSFWLSHVPTSRFEEFWRIVGRLLAEGGRVLFVDEHVDERVKEAYVPGADEIVERRLEDGATFRIVKNFVDPQALRDRLRHIGWDCRVHRVGIDWIRGEARRSTWPLPAPVSVEHAWARMIAENPDHSRWYIQRFRDMAAQGADLAGEARLIDAMVPRGARILDAGCGTGRVGGHLAAAGHDVVGVDLDPELIDAARQDHPGSQWLVGDLAELDLPAAGVASGFDAIVCAGNVMTFVAPPPGWRSCAASARTSARAVGSSSASARAAVTRSTRSRPTWRPPACTQSCS
jgi:2-polyprenyl-3-methyl-5-hydroxy-6-metoxy-1,4-benzoquinol methylase